MSPAKVDTTKKADPKAKALKAAKAVKSGQAFKKKDKKIRTKVTFHRPKTLTKARDPKYPRISATPRNKLDHYGILKYPLTTESAMKKIEDNNTLVFIVDIRADKKKIKDAVKKMYDIQTKKVNTLIRPDGTKKAYVRLTPDYDALFTLNPLLSFPNNLPEDIHCPNPSLRASCSLSSGYNLDSSENTYQKGSGSSWKRRQALVGVGTLLATSVPATLLLAEGNLPKTVSLLHSFGTKSITLFGLVMFLQRYQKATRLLWIKKTDILIIIHQTGGWEFDFRAHDSAFKDRYLQLQSVRVRFIPTEKTDIREVGPMDEVVYDLVKHKFAAPNQVATIYDMKERVEDGKSYYTFEYGLRTPIYATTCFATVAVGNNRYYTLIVGANERRWRKVKKQLEVVADSLKILQI
ncbi:hypothetical protein HID58_017329 [Brassica napus]|uniref:Ribosomal protein L23/L25 N-terminal domain-containing protein n=1 Tax=Brassica napus TaxID=3708 RepID=A0ABQ8D8G8_BRANA|nr:hypothetical protein HID58_017329 [Brassica napus]